MVIRLVLPFVLLSILFHVTLGKAIDVEEPVAFVIEQIPSKSETAEDTTQLRNTKDAPHTVNDEDLIASTDNKDTTTFRNTVETGGTIPSTVIKNADIITPSDTEDVKSSSGDIPDRKSRQFGFGLGYGFGGGYGGGYHGHHGHEHYAPDYGHHHGYDHGHGHGHGFDHGYGHGHGFDHGYGHGHGFDHYGHGHGHGFDNDYGHGHGHGGFGGGYGGGFGGGFGGGYGDHDHHHHGFGRGFVPEYALKRFSFYYPGGPVYSFENSRNVPVGDTTASGYSESGGSGPVPSAAGSQELNVAAVAMNKYEPPHSATVFSSPLEAAVQPVEHPIKEKEAYKNKTEKQEIVQDRSDEKECVCKNKSDPQKEVPAE